MNNEDNRLFIFRNCIRSDYFYVILLILCYSVVINWCPAVHLVMIHVNREAEKPNAHVAQRLFENTFLFQLCKMNQLDQNCVYHIFTGVLFSIPRRIFCAL